jgi:hypothetical protein
VALPNLAMSPSLNHAEPQNSAPSLLNAPIPGAAPVSQTLAAAVSIPAGTAISVGTSDPVASTIRQTAPADASVHFAVAKAENATLPDSKPLVGLETGPFFRTALQFLHLDQSFQADARSVGAGSFLSLINANAVTGLDIFKHSLSQGTTNTSAATSTSSLAEGQATASTIAGATSDLAPVLTSTSTQADPSANSAIPSKALPSAPSLDQPALSTALPTATPASMVVAAPSAPSAPPPAPPAPTVPSNTQLLLNFAGDATNATKASAEALNAVTAASHDTAGATRILVFDASWLSGKAFMLMPGIAMVENDALSGAASVALPPAAPVTLELGDGLSVQLLGILTV